MFCRQKKLAENSATHVVNTDNYDVVYVTAMGQSIGPAAVGFSFCNASRSHP